MFSRSFVNSSRILRGVRYNSTSTKPSAVTGLIHKITGLGNCAVYWSKVALEVGKQVYLKEGLAPPTGAQFQTVYKSFYEKVLHLSTKPQQVVELLNSVKLDKVNVLKYGAYGIQLLGLFSLGEIVGRRKIVGYPSYGHHSH